MLLDVLFYFSLEIEMTTKLKTDLRVFRVGSEKGFFFLIKVIPQRLM